MILEDFQHNLGWLTADWGEQRFPGLDSQIEYINPTFQSNFTSVITFRSEACGELVSLRRVLFRTFIYHFDLMFLRRKLDWSKWLSECWG
jgi:hypothetical protein